MMLISFTDWFVPISEWIDCKTDVGEVGEGDALYWTLCCVTGVVRLLLGM